MKRIVVLVATFTLCACGKSAPIDCREVYEKLDRCLEEAGAFEDSSKRTECIPHTEPIVITGHFAFAFEFNQFWEGPYAKQEDPWEFSWARTSLDIDRPPVRNDEGEMIGTVSEITFIGRKPLCKITANENWLLVDEILEEKVISSGPYR